MDPCGTQARLSKFASTSVLTFLSRERLSDVPFRTSCCMKPVSTQRQGKVPTTFGCCWQGWETTVMIKYLEAETKRKKMEKEYGGLHRFHS